MWQFHKFFGSPNVHQEIFEFWGMGRPTKRDLKRQKNKNNPFNYNRDFARHMSARSLIISSNLNVSKAPISSIMLGKMVCLVTRTDKLRRRGDKIVGTRASDLFNKVTQVILGYKA